MTSARTNDMIRIADLGKYAKLTAEEAAELVEDGQLVAFSGFTPAGAAKAVPRAIAERAKRLHAAGTPFQIRVLTGASTGHSLDDALAEADAISWRAPYQSSLPLRKRINDGRVAFVDMHLSQLPQAVLFGCFGAVDLAVIEVTDVTSDGKVFLTSSIGASPAYLLAAKRVILELNRFHCRTMSDMADILPTQIPPRRAAPSIDHPLQRVGNRYVQIDPAKIVGIVETNEPDEMHPFGPPDKISNAIAGHVVDFLLEELAAGRIPAEFLPLQSGVGNVANAVMEGLGEHPEIPNFYMYSEVFQDSLVGLMERERVLGASTCALTLSTNQLRKIHEHIDFFLPRIVLRSQDISNNPAVLRQLGVISMNTALEVDIYGHVNSTHVCGQTMMNGIGGSGDFARNAHLSFFMCPSFAKGGKVTTVVPMCTHVDHSEHSVQVIVTEQGLADLRGLQPTDRARRIIDRCAHPSYRGYLHRYLQHSSRGHERHDLTRCFELHHNWLQYGAMLPDVDWSDFVPEQGPFSLPKESRNA